MGYKLRREVRDALPPGLLTSAERLLVLEVADQCNDTTREGWPGADQLADLADLSPRSIQETLSRIGKKWVELRVPLGKDASGRPYYSHAGRRTTFRFPPMPPRKGATDAGASKGATDPGASGREGATDPGRRCDGSVPKVRQIRGPSPQGPTQNHSSLSPPVVDAPPAGSTVKEQERDEEASSPEPQDLRQHYVISHGATAGEAPRVVEAIQAEHTPRNNGWWHTVDRNGDLGDLVVQALARVRATTSDASSAADRTDQRPHCGSCDPSRLTWVRSASGRVGLAPCPDCHRRGKPLPAGAVIVDGPEAREPASRPDRAAPACGRSGCRDGWYRLGVNRVRCHVCADPNETPTADSTTKETMNS